MKGDQLDRAKVKIKQYQGMAQFVWDTGTYTRDTIDTNIDRAIFFIDSIKEKFGVFEKDIKEFVDLLKELEIINNVSYGESDTMDPEFYTGMSGFAYDAEVSIPRLKDFIKHGNNNVVTKPVHTEIKVHDIKLIEGSYLLEVNKGEKVVSFKSRKKGEGFDQETKQFKILFYLWEFRRELKDSKVLIKGNFTSLENLKRGSGCPSVKATYQHIKRINALFEKNNLPIEIRGENERYRLVINK